MICILLLYLMTPVGSSRRIAIIGGGISGTSTAFYLSHLFPDGIDVDLYEPNAIGGRLATVSVDGFDYEVGGSIIHSRNRMASFLTDHLGLSRKEVISDSARLGLMGDDGFVVVLSKYSVVRNIQLFWRYGFDLWTLERRIKSMLNAFDRIYALQEDKQAFLTVESLMEAADPSLLESMRISTLEGFSADGISKRLIKELVQAAVKSNYGQSTSVPKLVGSVSVVPALIDSSFSIEGGNKLIAEKLLAFSSANRIKEIVRQVQRGNDSRIIVTGDEQRAYDDVIISTPITLDDTRPNKIEFINFKNSIRVSGRYQRIITTLARGDLNKTFFGLTSSDATPWSIISVSENLFYFSVSRVESVSGPQVKSNVWKVFSRDVLSKDQLNDLFNGGIVEHVSKWLAYPRYKTEERSDSFILDDHLYYTNAMEWSSSAMETCLIGAYNVALLIFNSTLGQHTLTNYAARTEL